MNTTILSTILSKLQYFLIGLFLCLSLSCSNDDSDNSQDLDVLDPQEETVDENDDQADEDSQDEQNEDQADEDSQDEQNEDQSDEDSGEDENDDQADEDDENPGNGGENDDDSDDSNSCTNPGDFVFSEKDGLVNIEFEKAKFSGAWELKSNKNGFSGDGYISWTGPEHFTQPGNGKVNFKIKIKNPGTYQFLWKTAVTIGNDGTEHNDTWLRFSDADDFFAKKGSSVVYPKGTGKGPNPEGATKDGWFKIYRSGNDLGFKWQAYTYDNNAHKVFVTFDKAGIYTMEVSARSKGHGIDKFVLFKEPSTEEEAIANSTPFSAIDCN